MTAETINLEKALSEENTRLKTLQKVSEAIHGSLDPEKVFRQITDGAVHSMGYTTAFFIMSNKEKTLFEIKALSTKKKFLLLIDKALGFPLKNFSFQADPEINHSISSVLKGRMVVVSTLAEIAYPLINKKKCSALQKLTRTKNYIIMPLKVEEEITGGVFISSSRDEVSEEELRMLKSFANAASNAIFNAKLHEQTKQVDDALRKSEEKYKFLVDNSKEIILILDKKGKILFANKSASSIFGYSEEEVIGKSLTRFLTKDSIKKSLFALAQEFLGRSHPEMEVQARAKSGEIRYLRIAEGSTFIREKGKLTGVMISATDITARKKAHEELKSSEERLKLLFEFAPDAYYLSDLKGNFLDGNKAAEELTGYKKEELIGKNFLKLKLLPLGQIPKAARLLAKNTLGKPTGPDEFILMRKDGNRVTFEISTYPVKIKGKTLVLGIARDITERKRAEEELQKSEMVYRALFEHSSDAVFLLNPDGVHIAVNKKAADMLGYSIDELEGKPCKEIVAPTQYQNAREKMKGLLEGKSFPIYERIFRKKDGTEFPVEINVALVRDAANKPLFIQSIVRDITERKKSEEQIKASLREKEVMLKEIHHRVKNNMQIISSLVKLQSRNIRDEQAQEIFKSTQSRVRSMALIHEKLYRSQDLAQIDLAEYVQSLTVYLSNFYRSKTNFIKYHTYIKDVSLDINTAIPCGLIINELISNSLKYAFPNGKKGEIKISVHPLNKKELEMIVSDNGVGLPKKIDFRSTETLGLHLVTILAEDQLRGKIKLDRTKGTRFQIRFET